MHETHPCKTRDTNSYVENWFRTVKHNIFENKRYTFKVFVEKLYNSLNGRYVERIDVLNMERVSKDNNIQINLKLDDISPSLAEEKWSKRRAVTSKKKKSIYFNAPLKKIAKKKRNLKLILMTSVRH